MEKLLYIMLIWVVSTTSIYSQTVAGKIVDESNQPIEFANIVCLSLPDSTFIYGTISDQDGKFTIPENSSKGILRISSVGYATTYKECKDRNIGTILLHSDTQLLGEVVVKRQFACNSHERRCIGNKCAEQRISKGRIGKRCTGKSARYIEG